MRLVLLIAAVVLFLFAAFIDFHWLGASGDHESGLVALGLAAFAASLLPFDRFFR